MEISYCDLQYVDGYQTAVSQTNSAVCLFPVAICWRGSWKISFLGVFESKGGLDSPLSRLYLKIMYGKWKKTANITATVYFLRKQLLNKHNAEHALQARPVTLILLSVIQS